MEPTDVLSQLKNDFWQGVVSLRDSETSQPVKQMDQASDLLLEPST